ncbi:transposase [Pusillimonas sp. ANT_WB101]|uniref:transposase n=1 Tax=Pusillimonas sp. ANT_WB101 TaxID=2597356 RepID=UPI002102B2D5|nr:transposase [Pusillimonas sp. ANT_WB101]
MLAIAWERAWEHVISFFAFPPQIRKINYTNNAIESVNAQLRKIINTLRQFPTDESATKLFWLAIRNITVEWESAADQWTPSMQQFAILYEERFTQAYSYRDPESRAR